MMLVVYDLVTDGVRVRPIKAKAEIGDKWDKVPRQTTVQSDCGH